MTLPFGRPKAPVRPHPKPAYVRAITEYTNSTAASGEYGSLQQAATLRIAAFFATPVSSC